MYIKSKIVIILSGIFIVCGLVWMVFYSSIFINNQYLIPIRYWVDSNIKEKIYPYFLSILPYSISVRETRIVDNQLLYGYAILGKLASIDYASDLIRVKDINGITWKFNYEVKELPPGSDIWELPFTQIVVSKGEPEQDEIKKLTIYKDKENQAKMLDKFEVDDVIVIFFYDPRTYKQILSSMDREQNLVFIGDENKTMSIGKILVR